MPDSYSVYDDKEFVLRCFSNASWPFRFRPRIQYTSNWGGQGCVYTILTFPKSYPAMYFGQTAIIRGEVSIFVPTWITAENLEESLRERRTQGFLYKALLNFQEHLRQHNV